MSIDVYFVIIVIENDGICMLVTLFLLVRRGGVRVHTIWQRLLAGVFTSVSLVYNEHIGKLLMHKRPQCKLQWHALGFTITPKSCEEA